MTGFYWILITPEDRNQFLKYLHINKIFDILSNIASESCKKVSKDKGSNLLQMLFRYQIYLGHFLFHSILVKHFRFIKIFKAFGV